MNRLAKIVLALPCLFILPLATVAGGPIDPNNPPGGLFLDEWQEIYLLGGKIGYGHLTMSRRQDRIHTSTMMQMKIERAGIVVEMKVAQNTIETLSGEPIEFDFVTEMGKQPTRMKGTIAQGKVNIVTSQYGMERTQSLDFSAGSLMAWGLHRQMLLRGFEPGTEYSLPVYSPDIRLDAPITAAYRIGEEESYKHRGESHRGRKVVFTLRVPAGELEMLLWVDADGNAVKAVIPMAGLTMELLRTDQETAMADFVPPEFFMRTVVPSNRRINPDAAKRIKYRLSLKERSDAVLDVPSSGMQSVVKRDHGSVDLLVQRQDHQALGKAPPADPSSVASEFLAGNIILNTDDTELIKLADRATAGATRPIEIASRLREFVAEYVKEKSLGIGFATASEVCRAREGDCSEHAVLLAALGRIKGLPSRVAVGLVYVPRFGGQNDVFGFHMWTQFWIGGQWVDFDAALSESQCSPTRIAFVANSLKDTGLVEIGLALMEVIGTINVEVLEIDGK